MRRRRAFFGALPALLAAGSPAATLAQDVSGPSPAWAPIPANVVFETGDTWTDKGQRFRLYGVQSCIRGTIFTGADGVKRDCGEASLNMLTGLVRAWTPSCAAIAANASAAVTFVVCYADAITSAGRQRVELGTALIASGFAFAARDANGQPVHSAYAVAEESARSSKAGLWSAANLPNPNTLLLQALKGARRGP